jgi:hypothetical protein
VGRRRRRRRAVLLGRTVLWQAGGRHDVK